MNTVPTRISKKTHKPKGERNDDHNNNATLTMRYVCGRACTRMKTQISARQEPSELPPKHTRINNRSNEETQKQEATLNDQSTVHKEPPLPLSLHTEKRI